MDTTFRIEWDRQRWTVGATRGDATTVVLRGNAPPSGMTVQYVSWIVARLSTWAHGRGLRLPPSRSLMSTRMVGASRSPHRPEVRRFR